MEGRQSKCNYCIHALLGCSHLPSCAFKSECENSTLALLQRFVGLVLLELSEFSSRAFSQSGNYFSRVVPVMMLLASVSEKQRTNISTDRSGMAPKWGTEICVLIRFGTYRCHIGTGFRYPTLATSKLFFHASPVSVYALTCMCTWTLGWLDHMHEFTSLSYSMCLPKHMSIYVHKYSKICMLMSVSSDHQEQHQYAECRLHQCWFNWFIRTCHTLCQCNFQKQPNTWVCI